MKRWRPPWIKMHKKQNACAEQQITAPPNVQTAHVIHAIAKPPARARMHGERIREGSKPSFSRMRSNSRYNADVLHRKLGFYTHPLSRAGGNVLPSRPPV
ncbi:unnamed protein product [Schistocephalus solidus]|uniref:Uncharacterized protein n=1 Tax=Schistocephalus solidus TaxID=70667 RepID=A0A183T6I6_SCHSO|nr:unnamed protein product [Schistocephalus solidus]